MQLFKILQSNKQIVLSFERLPQLVRLASSTTGAVICGLVLPATFVERTSWQSWFGTILVLSFFLYFLLRAGRQFFRVIQGDIWIFDVENDLIIHNGKTVTRLKDIRYVQTWEDTEGEGPITRHFGLQDITGKNFAISDEISKGEWNHVVAAARQISAFIGIKPSGE